MMKHEFEDRIGYEVSNEEYKAIEFVYNWHPVFDTLPDPKDAIASLYDSLGMVAIKNMTETAEMWQHLNTLEAEARKKLEQIKERKSLVAMGDLAVEKTIAFVNNAFDESNSREEFERAIEMANLEKYDKAVKLGNLFSL